MFSIIKYSMLMARSSRLYVSLIFMSLIIIGISSFLGRTALVEEHEMQVIYSSSVLRVTIILGLIIFVTSNISNMFLNKEVDLILSRPVSRSNFVLSYMLGNIIISVILILIISLLLYLFVTPDLVGLFYWIFSFILEVIIIIAFVTTASIIVNNSVIVVVSCISFYVLSRLTGFFIIATNDQLNLVNQDVNAILLKIINYISVILPRLDLYTKGEWLIYGITNNFEVLLFFTQSIVYTTLLITVAIYDINNKQF